MLRIISFALGNIWRWEKSKNRDVFIKYAKKLDIDGVELTFASKEELFAFKLSLGNEKFLRGLKYVTIHAPFDFIGDNTTEKEQIKQLEVISKIYKQVNAKNVVIHPHSLPSKKILNEFNLKFSTENLRKKTNITIADLKRIFKEYPKLGLCLDVSHAYSWSKYETRKLTKTFGDRITQFHFSGAYRGKDHQSLRAVSKDFFSSTEVLLKSNAPIVIEEDMRIKSEKFLKQEVEFIKRMFSS
ncbi:MAG: TIM barrel protein [Candidatus Pacebacteria bacterium]|nr:TIM barrel protein [Candidatus Paceibacterota bacterium]